MAHEIEIKVPDIGGASQVDVIEVLVKIGDTISKDTPLITLESDKASMDIPSPVAGKITQLVAKVGDKLSEGDVILIASTESVPVSEHPSDKTKESGDRKQEEIIPTASFTLDTNQPKTIEITVPDIGGATEVDVIDVLIKSGDMVQKEQSLITLEGDKATMDIPCPYDGKVLAVNIKLGDKVAQGSPILTLETTSEPIETTSRQVSDEKRSPSSVLSVEKEPLKPSPEQPPLSEPIRSSNIISAGPAVRRMARELGVNTSLVTGSGRKNRITKEDIQAYVKMRLNEKPNATGFSVPSAPVIDFTQFGEIEVKPMNKIKKLTGLNVHRSWVTIPHVTQFDEADITELEEFRKSESEQCKESGYKLTILAFVCKVVSKALRVYPQFNASLDATGENLVYKKYCNIGIAVETSNGLVVPVIKNADKLSISDIALEMARLSLKAREKGLMPADMSGGCFTISSLGGIGGTAFTPIVNSPEVAILGLSRSAIKPVYEKNQFIPKLMLPLSLSYDHRVVDGAEAARFTRFICESLSDIRRILL